MILLFELSGEHPTLPCSELESVGSVMEYAPQVALADCPSVEDTKRLSLSHAVLEFLGKCEATGPAILELTKRLRITATDPFHVRVKKVQGASPDLSQLLLERLIGDRIRGEVSLNHPKIEYRVILSGGYAYVGRVLHHIDRGAFLYRDPLHRPFFHPGVMLPRLARAMVNLSLIRKGELLIDPFCGTGGMLLEARLLGAEFLGGDADPLMVSGTRTNIPHADVVVEDAVAMPFRDRVADAVVTDLPYGQSVGIWRSDLPNIYKGSLAEIHRILKNGRRAVLISHQDIRPLATDFTLLQYHEQRVHKSLTRRIQVLMKE
ncbi:MAG: methyltransferase domain-containing protein [Methanomicrobiales archaeon]|nr:methyltransferase domain-containing protein [Methanomicrobiales archaeon]